MPPQTRLCWMRPVPPGLRRGKGWDRAGLCIAVAPKVGIRIHLGFPGHSRCGLDLGLGHGWSPKRVCLTGLLVWRTLNLPSYFEVQGLERKPDEVAQQSGLRPSGPGSLSGAAGPSGLCSCNGAGLGHEPHPWALPGRRQCL